MDALAGVFALVIDDADHAVGRVTALRQFAEKQRAAVAGTDQQHQSPVPAAALPQMAQPAIFDGPKGEAWQRQQRGQHEQVEDQKGAREIIQAGDHELHRDKQQ